MYRCKIMLAMISIASSNMIGNQGSEDPETSPDIKREEEWHMDWVPTGYLPDSVYRELAWYGILQVQPLYRSAKHKVAARWIWQNTLGRPYVITEHQPQSRQNEDTVSRQAIAEESAKWSREHRMAQDVLMENIRTGGNGLTVRTVISDTQKSIYMIQNGVYYECEAGSEPDVEAFRTQANMHERKCTFDKQAELRPVDPCLDAEAAPLEYSFLHGWMFCLGDGERENTHSANGDLDCGRKIKISFNDFIKKCAVDNNVVITYEYFGDEPRKDMVHNTTLCTSWDPCRISYLYRIETEPAPELPTASPDPCDTTVCPACLEDGEPSISIDLQEESNIQPSEPSDHGNVDVVKFVTIEWLPATSDTFVKNKPYAIEAGHLASGERVFLIKGPLWFAPEQIRTGFFMENSKRARLSCCEFNDTSHDMNYFEVATLVNHHKSQNKAELKWVPKGNCSKPYIVYVNYNYYYKNNLSRAKPICRMYVNGNLLPGAVQTHLEQACWVKDESDSNGLTGKTSGTDYELLCATGKKDPRE